MNFQTLSTRLLTTIFVLLVTAAAPCRAATIFWGTFSNDTLIDSQGNALTGSYTFELGTFAPGFTPTDSNLTDWAANWMVFDAAVVGGAWNPANQEVTGTADHTATGGSSSPFAAPADIFPQGTPAYLWVYNTKDLNSNAEWALAADVDNGSNVYAAWEFPDPAEQGTPPLFLDMPSYDWQTRDLDTAIFGGVNNARGAGTFSATPVDFTIQTAAVPEPGSVMLFALGAFLMVRRARRMVR